MYTTDSIPLGVSKSIAKAWLIVTSRYLDSADKALSELKAKAAEGKADAVIGVRLVATEIPPYESLGKRTGGGSSWTAYGTAVRHSLSEDEKLAQTFERLRRVGEYTVPPLLPHWPKSDS
ncbi:heavy metal-binding domain-containing protein [Streptomyces sp. IBSBF 2806]|uniref:heavy metal-binding domain-containing protein n=1 Tax=Streptomyces sp. IBSBF 2806 TaxID=2903529 RepID=UPI002FDBCEEE